MANPVKMAGAIARRMANKETIEPAPVPSTLSKEYIDKNKKDLESTFKTNEDRAKKVRSFFGMKD